MRLDKLDFKILRILQENSKITNLELSKQIELSPAPTLERVKKLETNGIIQSYHAVIDATRLGIKVQTFVLIIIDWQKENALENFIKKMQDIQEVMEVYVITGEADAMLKVQCSDITRYEKLLFGEISSLPEVERIKTLMCLSTAKSSSVVPLDYEPSSKQQV